MPPSPASRVAEAQLGERRARNAQLQHRRPGGGPAARAQRRARPGGRRRFGHAVLDRQGRRDGTAGRKSARPSWPSLRSARPPTSPRSAATRLHRPGLADLAGHQRGRPARVLRASRCRLRSRSCARAGSPRRRSSRAAPVVAPMLPESAIQPTTTAATSTSLGKGNKVERRACQDRPRHRPRAITVIEGPRAGPRRWSCVRAGGFLSPGDRGPPAARRKARGE